MSRFETVSNGRDRVALPRVVAGDSSPGGRCRKDSTGAKVKYEMWLPKNLPLAGEYSILGMNNHGDVLVECRVGYDRTRFTWNTYTDTWVNIDATVLDSPDLVVIASEYLDRARGTVPWSAALEIYFAEESTRNNVNDSGQIAGTVWFTRRTDCQRGHTPAAGLPQRAAILPSLFSLMSKALVVVPSITKGMSPDSPGLLPAKVPISGELSTRVSHSWKNGTARPASALQFVPAGLTASMTTVS